MFIAKKNDLIIMAKETRRELEKALNMISYDEIIETEEKYTLYDGKYLTETEFQAKERARLNMLSLTAADVERAIYKAKGMDFEDIIEMVETLQFAEAEKVAGIDIKALKIELKANNFYRGNPYIDAVGALLGFTPEMLDEFFETNDYTKLVAPPEDVTQNEEI